MHANNENQLQRNRFGEVSRKKKKKKKKKLVSPLILMQLQITNVCSVRTGILRLNITIKRRNITIESQLL